jgi:hypothetical protein
MTDTGLPLNSPPSRLDAIKALVGDLARPFAIIVTSLGASATGIIIALRADDPDLTAASLFVGAIYTGVAALYGAKAWEVTKTSQASAEVAKAGIAGGQG